MFGRKDSDAHKASNPEPETRSTQGAPGRKGHPTPKRKEQEAARRRPLVPEDRKQAKKGARDEARQARMKQREAFNRGDESALPARDRGPVKRYIRNAVDSRWNVGEFLLPLMLIVLLFTLMPTAGLQRLGLYFVWVIVLVGVVDSFLLWRRLKKQIRERFHEDPPRRCATYAIMRSFQMRMSRVPKPQVKRGAKI
ncbi:DUF3043 domain-containing protein [Leekyejoonella antrihumi]|uniref:DUF3043 domain-containing protein n=1 Tax=Leekyejoonella antrihumi TaxID=1660198 RepID=UPI001FE4A3B0|nr:DUF3043 domain-containing protein [Leekyejoonella antrihumi]